MFEGIKKESKKFNFSSRIMQQMPDDFLEFNRLIGYPESPVRGRKVGSLTPSQIEFYGKYITEGRDWIHLNKARQCGWTELILRILAFHSFYKYRGKKIGIIAGTSSNTTRQIFGRFLELFYNISDQISDSSSLYLKLKNGTEIYGAPANVEAFTGWTKFGAFFMDESAKWNRTDDTPVLNAMLPIARSNNSDVFMISTPKGPRGFFYHIAMNPKSEFKPAIYDIWKGGEGLYTKPEIKSMIESSEEDPNQEYLCKFTVGRESIWGELEREDKEDISEYDL